MITSLLLLIVFIFGCFYLGQFVVEPLTQVLNYCAPTVLELYNEIIDYILNQEEDENLQN